MKGKKEKGQHKLNILVSLLRIFIFIIINESTN